MKTSSSIPLRIALYYAFFGGIWILSTDSLLEALVSNTKTLTQIQTYKGWAFVAASALVIFLLLRRELSLRHITEGELEESKKRYHTAFDDMLEGVQIINRDWRYVYVNEAVARQGRSTPANLVGRTMMDAYPGIEKTDMFSMLRDCMENRVTAQMENEFKYADGSSGWFSLSIQPALEGILILSFDITERKRAEERLAFSEARHRVISELISDYVYILRMEGNGKFSIEWVSGSLERLCGYSPAEVEAMGGPMAITHPDDLPAYRATFEKTMQGETTIMEIRMLSKSGVTRWARSYTRPVWDEDHTHIVKIVGAGQDITNQKLAETKLRESEALYRRAMEVGGAVPYYESYYDQARRVKYEFVGAGIREITGYGPEEFTAAIWDTLVEESHPAEELAGYSLDDAIQKVRSGEIPIWKCEFRIHARDGSVHWVYESAVELRDNNGALIGSIGSYQDITKRKQADISLAQRLAELELLYQSGLTISGELDAKQIAAKLIEALEKTMDWHHIAIRQYDAENDRLELLAFNQPSLESEMQRQAMQSRFNQLIANASQGLSGWVVQNGQAIRSDNVHADERYIEVNPGIHSGLYVPIMLGGRALGVISAESKEPNAFRESDERLLKTVATQAAVALENARLFQSLQRELGERALAEQKLRQSEEQYRFLLDNTSDFIAIYDRNGIMKFGTEASLRFNGYRPDEIINTTSLDRIHPDDRDYARQELERVLRDDTEGRAEYRVKRKDGGYFWAEASGRSVQNAAEEPEVIVVQRDITERKQAEEKLRANEERYRSIVENLNQAYYEADHNGLFTYCNPGVLLVGGYSDGELLGRSSFRLIAPEHRRQVFEAYKQGMQDKRSNMSIEFLAQVKDGRKFWVEQTSHFEFDPEGVFVKATNILKDIDERKRAEEALRGSEERFRSLYENATIGMYRTTPDGRILLSNPALVKMLGFESFDELAKRNLEDENNATHQRARFREQIEKEGIVRGIEASWKRKDGTLIFVRESASVGYDSDGRVAYYEGTVEDFTERKQAEEATRASEARYHTLFEDSPIAIWEEDFSVVKKHLDGLKRQGVENFMDHFNEHPDDLLECSGLIRITDVNRSALEMYQADEKNALIENTNQTVSQGELAQLPLIFAEIAAGKLRGGWEGEDETLTENPIVIRLTWSVVPGYEEDYSKVIVTTVDITERKRAEEQVVALEAFTRSAFDALSANICVIDETGKIVMVNRSWKDFALTNNEEPERVSEGANYLTVCENATGSERYQAREFAAGIRLVLSGKCAEFSMEYPCHSEQEKRWFIARVTRFQSGASNQAVIAHMNISGRKLTEEALHISEERFSTIFHSSPNPIAITRLSDGKLIDMNEAWQAITGYAWEEAIGRNPVDLNLWVDPAERSRLTQKVSEREAVQAFEMRLRKKTGEIRILLMSAEIVKLQEELCILTTAQDVTELKQAEQAVHLYTEQLQTAGEMGRTLASHLDVEKIYQNLAQAVKRLLPDVATVFVSRFAAEEKTITAVYGLQDDDALDVSKLPPLPFAPEGQGSQSTVIYTGTPLIVADLKNKLAGRFQVRVGADERETQSAAYVPLAAQDRILGVLHVQSYTPNRFHQTDVELLTLVGNTAAVAIQNAELFAETRQRVRELETVNHISVALRASANQEQALAIMLEETLNVFNTRHGAISLWDEESETLHSVIARGWPAAMMERPIRSGEGIFGTVFAGGETYISSDFANDPLTLPQSRPLLPLGWGGACIPIRANEKSLGVLTLAIPSQRVLRREDVRLLETLAEMVGTAINRMNLNEEVQRHLERLQSLRQIDAAIAGSFDRRATLETILAQVLSQLGVSAADILMLDSKTQALHMGAYKGFTTELDESIYVPIGRGFAGVAVSEKRIVRADLQSVREVPAFYKLWQKEGFSSYHAIPLIVKGRPIGVLETYQRTLSTPSKEWFNFLETLAGQAGIALENAGLFENLENVNAELIQAYDSTIEGWSHAMDLRDKETEGHTIRVADLTMRLARTMGSSPADLIHIRRGALLHDIGKMGVPDRILLKPDKLTDDEWTIMRMHPTFAYEMLEEIHYLRPALNIPYCHHEKWDGTGYPRGLVGQEIPLEARIFAVVDVWDALTSDRPYRPAWTREKTLEYIHEQSGKQFDPDVVTIFLQIIEADRQTGLQSDA